MAESVLPAGIPCPPDGKILKYYKGQFESVYILLHPFLHPVAMDVIRFQPHTWPTKMEIIEGCEPVAWKRVLELTGLKTLSEIDAGLRTSIGGLRKAFRNEAAAAKLEGLVADESIIHPTEGELPPLLENRILKAFQALGYGRLWVGDEFGAERKLFSIEELSAEDHVPLHGSIFTEDYRLLVTTHWDSHCSFLCSSKEIIERVLAFDRFEGFYCTDKTEVYWGLDEI